MKTSEVKILLQKYYSGLTSAEEEADLEKFFLEGQAELEFNADRVHFLSVAAMRDEDIPVPDDLENSVRMTLDQVRKNEDRGKRRALFTVFSVAAGLLLLVSTFVFLSRQDESVYIDDPGIAYAESRDALEMVSKLFNEGTSRLSGLSRINDAVEPLSQLNTLDKAAKSLSELGKLENQK